MRVPLALKVRVPLALKVIVRVVVGMRVGIFFHREILAGTDSDLQKVSPFSMSSHSGATLILCYRLPAGRKNLPLQVLKSISAGSYAT